MSFMFLTLTQFAPSQVASVFQNVRDTTLSFFMAGNSTFTSQFYYLCNGFTQKHTHIHSHPPHIHTHSHTSTLTHTHKLTPPSFSLTHTTPSETY